MQHSSGSRGEMKINFLFINLRKQEQPNSPSVKGLNRRRDTVSITQTIKEGGSRRVEYITENIMW